MYLYPSVEALMLNQKWRYTSMYLYPSVEALMLNMFEYTFKNGPRTKIVKYKRAFKGTVYWKLWNVESNRYISLVGKLFLMETTMRGALNKLLSLHNILIVILSKYHAYSIGLLMDKLNGATWLTIAIFWHFFKLNWKIHLSACWLPPIHTPLSTPPYPNLLNPWCMWWKQSNMLYSMYHPPLPP